MRPPAARPRARLTRTLPGALLALLLGAAAALLVSCGSSSGKLIPAANAGPLQSDFEAVAQAAQSGNGSCAQTEAAILKTEQDYAALPATVDAGLRSTLRQGISNLAARARSLCAQPFTQTTTTGSSPKTSTNTTTGTSTGTTTASKTPTVTQTTSSQTAPAPTSTPAPPTTPGAGGTPAPKEGEAPPAGQAGGGAEGEGGGGSGVGPGGAGAGK